MNWRKMFVLWAASLAPVVSTGEALAHESLKSPSVEAVVHRGIVTGALSFDYAALGGGENNVKISFECRSNFGSCGVIDFNRDVVGVDEHYRMFEVSVSGAPGAYFRVAITAVVEPVRGPVHRTTKTLILKVDSRTKEVTEISDAELRTAVLAAKDILPNPRANLEPGDRPNEGFLSKRNIHPGKGEEIVLDLAANVDDFPDEEIANKRILRRSPSPIDVYEFMAQGAK